MTYNPYVTHLALQVQELAQADASVTPAVQVWVSESGGSYNSGSEEATGSFASGFWFLNALAMTHHAGHRHFCRQTLAGGYYGLLSNESPRDPHPDYWNALFYQRLFASPSPLLINSVGSTICVSYNDGTTQHVDGSRIRWYVYHSKRRDDSLVMLGVNFHNVTRCGFVFSSEKTLVTEFVLTPDGHELDPWNTTGAKLNGHRLEVGKDGHFPNIEGVDATVDTLWLDPLSYGFFEVPVNARSSTAAT
jgi:Glycosyl hydrolase family 79, N-terminal domain